MILTAYEADVNGCSQTEDITEIHATVLFR